MAKPDINASLRRTEKFLDSALEEADQRILRAMEQLESRIVRLASGLEIDAAGNIKGPKWTLKQAQTIHKQLATEFADTFGEAIQSNVQGFDTVAAFVEAQFAALDVPVAFSTLDREVIDALKAQSFAVYDGLSMETQNRVAQAVYDSAIAGETFERLTAKIAAALIGHKDVRGRPLSQYATTYAQDSLMEFYSELHRTKAKEAGLEHFIYYGDIIRTTRPFCRTRAGKVFTAAEVDSWNRLGPWKGRKPGPVQLVRGGYNCRHHLHAVDPSWVPEEGVEVLVYRDGEPEVQRKGSLAQITPKGFQEAKTRKEAEDYAVNVLGVKSASFQGIGVDVANKVTKAIGAFKERFPELRLDAIKTVKKTRRGMPSFWLSNLTDAPMKEVGTNTLKINKAVFAGKSVAELEALAVEAADKGWWVPRNIEDMVWHELGHTMTFQGLTGVQMEAREYQIAPVRFRRDNLSEYATESGFEGIAETFAKYGQVGTVDGIKLESGTTASEFIKNLLGVKL